jgi:hypothetical protein
LASTALLAQVDVAARVHDGQLPFGQGILALCVGRSRSADRTRHGCVQGGNAFVDIDRVHLGEQLPGLDAVTHIDGDAQYPPGCGGADQIGAPGFDRTDAKERRSDGSGCRPVHGDLGARQRAGANTHKRHTAEQQHGEQAEPQPTVERAIDLHGTSLMPRW